MRKRIWAILVSVCLLIGILPVTAMADETGYNAYEAFKTAMAESSSDAVSTSSFNFTWPTAEDTIDIARPINLDCDWTIPSNITLNFKSVSSSQGTISTYSTNYTLIVKGTIKTEVDNPLRCSVTINNGGNITGTSVRGMAIGQGYTWNIENGGTLSANTILLGTLSGDGTVSGDIDVRGGYSGINSDAKLSGNLTITGGITVGYYGTSTYTDLLTITEGSKIKFSPEGYKFIAVCKNATLAINGELEISGSNDNGLYLNNGGKLKMNGGVLTMNKPCKIGGELSYSDNEVLRVETPYITGSGTIKFSGESSYYGLLYFKPEDAKDWLYPDAYNYIENGINVEYNWTNDGHTHTWSEWTVTKEPTETESGEKTRKCTTCEETQTIIIQALGNSSSGDDNKDDDDGDDIQTSTSSGSSHSLTQKKSGTVDVENTVKGTETAAETPVFLDVSKSNPNYEAIISAYEKGYMAGISDGVFAPEGTLTRGMAARILWNMAGNPEPTGVAPFLDVTSGEWYSDPIAWAYEQGIILGYDSSTFGPNDFVTIEQFEIMITKYGGGVPEAYTGVSPNATRGYIAGRIFI